ncbi:MAG TPA: tRNA pseudouridine(55) synthase TruB [Geobacteraceae bacterium]|nr:tRNA pseudouridine(55) synthase TruB [Geobacteraceae bacterium]
MNGFIIIDKPAGMTSHDVVSAVRRITGVKKAGHTGTLDPFATGVLPVALGEGTKAIQFLDEARKEYRAVMKLGETTDTQDLTGAVTDGGDWRAVTPGDMEKLIARYSGRISQLPPMFSALKHKGVPLYRLARRGAEISRELREIEIYSLVIDYFDLPEVAFTVACSRGTYVRTLAHDMGAELGCGAHLVRLRRTMSGPFDLSKAVSLNLLSALAGAGEAADLVISPYDALDHLPDLQVNDCGRMKVGHGIVPDRGEFTHLPAALFRQGINLRISQGRRLLAVAEVAAGNEQSIRLVRVFN